ncbi:MAG: hypothetical protein EOO90_21700 [Pedobacter sp.]|nr:MAG: hypothetical protein EOO90_21700 [Pedobacter sp.]
MKTYDLILTLRVSMESGLDSLSDTVQDFEAGCRYSIEGTDLVKVTETELMESPLAYPPKP